MKNKSNVGRRIILADDTTFEDSNAGYADGVLWCRVTIADASFAAIATIFSDPEKTAHIRYEYGEMADEYDGFTTVLTIMRTEYGFDISLRKDNGHDA